ncbi:MAG: FKBP-type peptidyl-prolyl cis-trans isomerase [Syntrophaceae bacterium]|jgi:FKBP-type peptidyl-prolyl cis-trans isomerase FkpA|nr:FKBP-type peptidyl-prolyl cis-trans isomerase [Syntrophaceae bacterium]HOE78934.1 FKBP-type peptidyl-prolyl cis-trans isomerase [Smithellaceae bacterium]HQF84525.1 FKBP-type peptidyl-prolyl cis-trans isomerase [Smithellaceae bacterium]HQG80893.1 FKBP-type peptidyl-prolyl cis-trans isomerase [Smithellaceae bacterium]
MRKLLIIAAAMVVAAWGCSPQAPKTEEHKAFYALGAHLNKQLSVFDLTPEEFRYVQQGMADSAAGKKLAVEPEDQLRKLGELAQSRMERATEKQKEKSKAYLEKAAAEKGAQKMESGLIYTELKAGTGAQPGASDIVKVHYVGKLIDGSEFDSSIKRGQPVDLPLNQVFPCWAEGVQMMKVGGKAKLVCPSEIAYGDRGRPPVVPGGATLIFEVELLGTKEQPVGGAPSVPPLPPAPKAKKQSQ